MCCKRDDLSDERLLVKLRYRQFIGQRLEEKGESWRGKHPRLVENMEAAITMDNCDYRVDLKVWRKIVAQLRVVEMMEEDSNEMTLNVSQANSFWGKLGEIKSEAIRLATSWVERRQPKYGYKFISGLEILSSVSCQMMENCDKLARKK